jgi:hypothetical protein
MLTAGSDNFGPPDKAAGQWLDERSHPSSTPAEATSAAGPGQFPARVVELLFGEKLLLYDGG